MSLFLKVPELPYNTLRDRSKEAPMPKIRLTRPAVSIEHKLVTNRHRQRDRHVAIASNRANFRAGIYFSGPVETKHASLYRVALNIKNGK